MNTPRGFRSTDTPTAPSLPPSPLLRVRDAAQMLCLTEKALRHRIDRGQIPGVVRIGASVFVRRADLLGLIAEGRGPSPSGSR